MQQGSSCMRNKNYGISSTCPQNTKYVLYTVILASFNLLSNSALVPRTWRLCSLRSLRISWNYHKLMQTQHSWCGAIIQDIARAPSLKSPYTAQYGNIPPERVQSILLLPLYLPHFHWKAIKELVFVITWRMYLWYSGFPYGCSQFIFPTYPTWIINAIVQVNISN